MKLTKKIVFLVLACLLVLTPLCYATNKLEPRSNTQGTDLPTSQNKSESVKIINTDLYVGDQNVVINDTVEGNAFAFGSTVVVNGNIKGDLFVMGNTVTIDESAVIFGNVFAFASNIVMKGNVTYDVYAFSQNFELASTGYISRDIRAYGEKVTLNGIVKRDAHIASNSIIMPDNAKNIIGGDLNYTSDNEFVFPKEAVSGNINHTPVKTNTPTTQEIISTYITRFITTMLYAIVIILLATFFAPKFVEKANYVLMKKSFASAGIGILAFILIPVFAIILLMTGFLSYISLAALVVYGLILSITLAIFSMAIGKSIEKKLNTSSKGKFILFSILSAIVLWLAQIIPYIGGYLSLFIYVVGLGVFLYSFFMRKDVSELEKK